MKGEEQHDDEGEPDTKVEVELDKDEKVPPVDEVAKTPKTRKPKVPAPAASQPQTLQAEQVPSVGRIVHFRIPSAMHGGADPVHRPAIVSNVRNAKKGIVDLHVFVTRDDYPGKYHPGPLMTADKVGYSESEEDGTWHWPERV
jgi:hypothetical protein